MVSAWKGDGLLERRAKKLGRHPDPAHYLVSADHQTGPSGEKLKGPALHAVRWAETIAPMSSPQTLPETDLSLLHRFADRGDEDAFSEIVRRYAGVVFCACHRVLRDRGWAEDVAQETFFRLVKCPDRVSHSLGGWLHRAATRLAVDTLRSEQARHRREATYEAPAKDEDGAGAGAGSQWEEISPVIDEALDELDDDTRALLVRHFLQGTPQAELAAEAGVSAATMSRRVKHAINELRERLGGKGITVAPSVLVMLCARNAIETAPQALLGELGKMAMVSGAAAKANALGIIPSWASSIPSPTAMARAVAREWPRVSLCAAVGLGLYLAVPYVPWLRADRRPPPQEVHEVRKEPEAAPAMSVSGAALRAAAGPASAPSVDE
jgi:RNA polymerase sigma-70 factor (ECF subfamily)